MMFYQKQQVIKTMNKIYIIYRYILILNLLNKINMDIQQFFLMNFQILQNKLQEYIEIIQKLIKIKNMYIDQILTKYNLMISIKKLIKIINLLIVVN